jgi:hypothetical protein
MHQKVDEFVTVPQDFRSVAGEIVRQIDFRTPEATTVSDDLLQFDCAYAGRTDEIDVFSLRYFPTVSSNMPIGPKWDFLLSVDDLRQIANFNVRRLKMWRCKSDCGMKANYSDFYCGNCDT